MRYPGSSPPLIDIRCKSAEFVTSPGVC
jgi:hypothetical protein